MTPAIPEWRRSGPFLLFAVMLHALVLAAAPYGTMGASDITLPPLNVTIVQAPAALPVAATRPEPAHPSVARPGRERQRSTPVLAMTPTQQPVAVASTIVPPPTPMPVIEPPTKPATSSSAPQAGNSTVSNARFDAAYLQNPKPTYPALSRRMGEEGKVLLKVRVSSEGRPLAVDLEKSSNFERLDHAALQAVTNWRFVPAKRGDEAIEASVIVPITFRLDS